jgi:hypothetical protein
MEIQVGFGSAFVTKDDETVWDEQCAEYHDEKMWTVEDAEKAAVSDPDHDWRIHRHGPLHGEVFQRQGQNEWVCIESEQGFA